MKEEKKRAEKRERKEKEEEEERLRPFVGFVKYTLGLKHQVRDSFYALLVSKEIRSKFLKFFISY